MSISFSGLASGLDTSSWVESLVALKKAKVTSLEEEKKEVQSLQETLTQIKSFFSSFRSMLEKVTDAKFGVASMDLFAQNLATSSNLEALTASATTEAEEATYNVLVDKLASETKANSNYSYMTTIIQTTTATVDSKLINLGVKAGNIGVTVNGVEHGINITENDTISTFIEKLNNIGVKASYNEGSGVFSIDVGENSIRDIDSTGIVDALHLKGVNEGYTSDSLKTSTTDTIFSAATETTKLSELGVKNGTVTIHANDKDYSFTINQNTTLGGFIADLKNKNIEASLDKDGVFTITDADITNEGSTDIKNALGLTSTVYEKAQITGDLTHKTIVTQTTTATSGTLLKDLGTGVKIEDNQTVVVKNSNNETTTITVGTTTTLGQLIEKISNAGLYAALKSDGTVEIAGGTITGGTFDAEKALGLEKEPYTAIVTGKSLTETVEVHKIVTLQTKLVDDLKVKEGYLEVTDADGNKFYEKIYSGQTIADFMADMGNLGINTSLDEDTGVLTITGGAFKTLSDADVKALVANGTIRETQDRFKQGTNLLACLYGADTIATEQITVASTHSKTRALRHTVVNTIDATKTTTLGNLGLSGTGTAIFDVRGEKRTITVDKTMTIEGLMNALKNAGIASSWSDEHSKILIENSTLTGGTSNLAGVLNLTTEVSGKYITSSELYSTDTVTIDATRATVLKDYGIKNSMSQADRTVTIYNSDGTVAGSTVVTESTTIGNLLDFINSKNGISANLTDGYLRVDNGYIGNATLEATMGLKTSNKSSYVLGSVMTVTTTSAVSGNTTLENIFRTIGTLDKVSGGYTLNFNSKSISVSATTTLNELISKIAQNGGNASLDATGRLSIDGGTLTGTVAEALGMTTVTNTVSVSASGQTMLVKQTIYANRDTKLSDLGVTGNTTYVVHNSLGQATTTVTLANTTSLGAFIDGLKAHQIDGVIADGVIKLDSASGQYITGDLATKLGIATQTVTDIVNTTVYSTSAVQYTATGKADLDTKLGSILAVNTSNNTLVVYNSLNTAKTTITVSGTTTLDELFGTLAKQGIQAEVNNGVISFVSKEGNYVTGSIIDSFGMTTTTVRVTTTTGTSATSSKFTHTVNENAKITDKISTFVNVSGNQTIVVKDDKTGAARGTVTVTSSSTFESMFKALDDLGIQGTMEDGVITLTSNNGAWATGEILTTLGIGTVTKTVTITTTTTTGTNKTSSKFTYTVNENAKITDTLGTFVNVSGNQTIVVKDDKTGAARGTVTVTSSSTFESMFKALDDLGIQGTMEDGVITLTSNNGAWATGEILTTLGIGTVTKTVTITTTTTTGTNKTSSKFTYTVNENAKITDTLGTFVNVSGNQTIVVKDDKTGAARGTVTVTSSSTFESMFKALDDLGIQGTMEDGVITLTSNNGAWATGEILTTLGIGTVTKTVTITTTTTTGTNKTSSKFTYTVNENAKITDTLGTFVNVSGNQTIVVKDDKTGAAHGTVTVTSSSTFESMFKALDDLGIQGTMEDGVITLTSNNGAWATGEILTTLGIGTVTKTVTITTTTTTGTNKTSSKFTYTNNEAATITDKISTFISLPTNKTITIKENQTGATVGTVTIDNNTTFESLFKALDDYGVQATMEDGVITITSNRGRWAEGAVLTSLGVSATTQTSTTTTTKTVGTSKTTGSLTYTKSEAAKITDKISTFISLPENKIITVKENQTGATVGTVTIDNNTTFESLFKALDDYGVQATMEDGVITITSNRGRWAEGSVLTSLGVSATTQTSITTTTKTVGTSKTAGAITYTKTETAKMTDKLGDFRSLPENKTITIKENKTGANVATITVSTYTTFESMFKALDDYGIQGTMEDGVITITSNRGRWIEGDVLTTFGISAVTQTTTTTTTKTVGTRATSGALTYTGTQVAKITDRLSNYIDLSQASAIGPKLIVIHPNQNGTSVTTDTLLNGAIAASFTFEDLFRLLDNYGIQGTMEDGVIMLTSNGNSYVDGWLAGQLGISIIHTTTNVDTTITVGTGATTGTLTYTTTETAKITDKISDVWDLSNPRGSEIFVFKNGQYGILASFGSTDITDNTTFQQFFNMLAQYGIQATMADGVITMTSNVGNYVDGWFIDDLCGIGSVAVTKTVGTISTTGTLTYVKTETVETTTTETVSRKLLYSDNASVASLAGNYVMQNQAGEYRYTISINSTDTIATMLEKLNKNGQGIVFMYNEDTGKFTVIQNYENDTFWGLDSTSAQKLRIFTNAIHYNSGSRVPNVYAGTSNSAFTTNATKTVTVMQTVTTNNNIESTTTITTAMGTGTISVVCQGTTYNVTVSAGKTIGDVMNELAGYGISGSLKDGVLKFQGTGDGYVTDWGGAFNLTGNGYVERTEYEKFNNVSQVLSNVVTHNADANTTITTAMGTGTISVVCQGTTYNVTVSSGKTIGDVMNELAGYGISGSLVNGVLNFQGTKNCYVTNWGGAFSLTGSYYTTTTETTSRIITSNTLSNKQQRNVTHIADATTEFTSGISGGIITLNYQGTTYTVTAAEGKTIGTVMNELAGYGISGSLKGGILIFQGTGDGYVTNWNGAFGLSGSSYTVSTITTTATTGSNTLSNRQSRSVTYKADETTTITADMHTGLISVNYQGNDYNVIVSVGKTIGTVMNELAGFGISSSLVNGVLTFQGTGDGYVTNWNGVFDLTGNSYTVSTISTTATTGSNSLSNRQNHNVTYRADATTTITTAMGTGTITLNYQGTAYNVTVSTAKTIGDVMNELAGYGISGSLVNGVLKFQGTGDGYVTNWGSAFGLTGSSYSTTVTSTTITTGSNTLSNRQNHNVTYDAQATTKISQTSAGKGTITVNYQGGTYYVTVSGDKTIGDVMNELAGYGISGSLVNGVLKFQGTGDGYVTNWGSAFGLTGASYSTATTSTTITTGSNTLSNRQNHNRTYNADATTTITTAMGTGTINVRYEGNNYNVTVSAGKTIGDVMNELAGFGISGSLVNGVLKFTGTGDGYVTNWNGAFGLTGASYSTATTSTTITTGSNTLSNRQNHNVTYDAQATTKISQTSAGKGTITVNYQGNTYYVTVSDNKTIGDIMNELAGYGISGSLQGGVLKFQGTGDGYVTNWGSAFGLTGASYGTVTTSTTITTGSNTLSNRQNHNVTYDAQATTKISQTSAGKGTITVNYQGNTYYVTASDNKTIGDIMNELAGYGISGSLQDGVLKFQGTGDGYVTNWGGAFGLTGASYGTVTTSTTITTGSNTLSNRQNHNVTYDAQATTKISQTSAGKGTITVNYQGNTYNVTVSGDKTIGDVMNELAGYGISGSLKEGVLKFQGTGDGYVTNWGGAFGLTGASYGTVTTSTTITTGSNTLSNRQNHNVTYNANATTKMSQTSAGKGTITVNYEGKTYYVTATADKTIGEILNELAGYGISGSIKEGVIKLQGTSDGYITNAGGVFGLTGSFYGTTTVTIKANKTSNDLSYTSANVTLTTDTKISAINGYSGGSGSLIIHKTDGTYVTISVDASKTLGEFFTQLSQYGLVGRVDDSGKVSIDGIGNVYMQQASGGSNILTALKLSNVRTNVKTVTVNRTSDTLHHTITVAASGTTQLGNLQLSNGTGINFTGNNAALILRTTSDAGNKFVTINFSKTQSIYDVIAALANYGIDARIDSNGRFSMSSSTLTDFEISGALGTFLMGTYSKKYGTDTTYNTSTNLLETTTVFMKDSDALSTFGVTGGNIIINQEGVKYTVNVDTTQIRTVGDFRNLLSKYGFNSYIDDHGRLNVEGIGNSTLEQITGGSNILDKFGLLDWTLGEITQNSDHLTDTEVITRRISMSDKLKDLTNSSGVNLGITAGQIYVYQDGTRSTLNIDVNDTLETLQAKLAQYGITVGISQNGQLYFDGNNDSYLTTNGISSSSASNILQKFGISGTWSTRYDSTSEKLDYTTTSNNVVTGSTKLKDLNGADGKNLGITTGAFYVYNSGVRTTEQIEEDMTVNDLMAILAKYGLVADIDENGSISVGAYNNTYLATSALSSANSNIVSTLFAQWDFVNIYKSNHLDIPTDEIRAITRDTKLSDINEGTYKAGYITVVKDGVKTNISLTADDTVGTLMDELALYGFESVINDKGQLMIKNTGNSLLQNYSDASKASNALTLLGIDLNNWINTNTYESGTLDVTKTSTIDAKATRDTLLSQLGVTTGEYYIYNNGVKYTAMISSDETIGSFMDTLKSFGIETSLVEKDGGSVLTIVGKGDSYLKKSTSTTNSSNVVEQLFKEGKTAMEYSGLEQTSSIQTTFTAATEDTLVSYFDKPWNGSKLQSEGDLTVVVNGQKNTVKIVADDTFGTLLEKFRALGIEATMSNGQIMLQSGYDTLTITPDGTTSNLLTNIKLVYKDDLGGYSASNVTVKSTTTNIEEKTLSVANYANSNTKLSDLNISEGTLTIYRDGIKAQINIDENDTFTTLQSRISEKFNKDNDVIVTFEDGYLKIYSKSGKNIEVGATSDSSNFGAITGIASDGSGVAKSARELYCVIGDSKITANGLFRRGNVKAGTFTVGDAVFTITNDTKLSDLISQINSSDTANATAFWDNVEGKLVIKSRTTGAALVNIEAGTSNFTDIMGFTTSQWNGDGSLKTTKMNIDTQEIGDNAKIKINGTTYTSTSNNITSDVTRIKGLTINLKGLTKDSSVTLKVERDKETLANAVSSVVDSYNELMKNVDEAIASDGDLKNESTLKLIRNQLRNLMTSSDAGTTVFRNLDSIGIGASSASGSNISTANSAIISLTFDKDKFLKAYEADQDAVKELIIGGANNKGVFTKVEDLVESTLKSVSGYFASTETSYTNKIRDLDKKITKANKEVDRYKARLEAKFQSMDMLIAQMQQQYSSFLKT